jgi:uncharacterized protein YaaN involved in tellurite resistance
MNEATKNQIVSKLGMMQFANAELAGDNQVLRQLAGHQNEKISELQKELAAVKANNEALIAKVQDMAAAAVDNLPANPYAEPNGEAKVH